MNKFKPFTFLLVLTLTLSSTFSYASTELNGSNSNSVSEMFELVESPDANSILIQDTDAEKVNTNIEIIEDEDNSLTQNEITETESQVISVQVQDPEQQKKVKKLNAVTSFIKTKNSSLSDAVSKKVAEAAISASSNNSIDLGLVLAVMWKESTFSATAVNPSGCYGLMQISKSTGAGFGYSVKDLMDPYRNAEVGAKLLKGQISKFGDTIKGLSAYNHGGGNVSKGNYTTTYAKNVLEKQKVINSYINSYMSK